MSIEDQISHLVSGFVADITKLARQAAIETLTGALAGRGVAAPRARIAARTTPAAVAAAPRRRKKGEKRGKADIESTQATVVDHIRRNPGLRIEQINVTLGTKTKDLRLPLAKAIEAGDVKAKGNRRATKYFPG